jgi:hypothetical protein
VAGYATDRIPVSIAGFKVAVRQDRSATKRTEAAARRLAELGASRGVVKAFPTDGMLTQAIDLDSLFEALFGDTQSSGSSGSGELSPP